MTTGILGGTFDPPHVAHLIIAEFVRQALSLDRIVFIPAAVPPHKRDVQITPAAHRLEMLRLAISGNPAFDVDDLELRREGVSYTVDTLDELHRRRPDDKLILLIGEDNLADFRTWKDPDRILKLAQVIAMTRPGFTAGPHIPLGEGVTICEVPELEIASRKIREMVRSGRSVRYLVLDKVEEYIRTHHLYSGSL